jgi:hypothetical protein
MKGFDELDSEEIVRLKTVPFPGDKLGHGYPEY